MSLGERTERSRRTMAGRWWTILIWLCLQDTSAHTLHVSLMAVIVLSALRNIAAVPMSTSANGLIQICA